jgi:hypothetical protein
MRIRVKGRDGFAMRLNYAAEISDVRAAGKQSAYFFGGGLFWAELAEGETELTIQYSIEVEKCPEGANSGCFLESAGHVRNQYFWHPYFGFGNVGDFADFHIEVRIPKEYRLSTSLPQTERVEGGQRIVEGKTIQPAFDLTLVYDRDWKVESRSFGDTRVEFFVTPQIQPDLTTISDEFRSLYGLLAAHFGALPGGYFAVVQARSLDNNSPGWRFASNQAVVAATAPGALSAKSPFPTSHMGHEIAHLWTDSATGPAMSFLTEGWAVWAESLIQENEFGPQTAEEFWKNLAAIYLPALDGRASLIEDESNRLVAYIKGPWVFHMLQEAMGTSGFEKAMAEYSGLSLAHPAGWELLAECAQRYAPPDLEVRSFILPWLTEKRAPHLTAQIDGPKVTIRQEPPNFVLPVVVEASTARGPESHRVWIKGPEAVVMFSGDVSEVIIDPDGSLLLRR